MLPLVTVFACFVSPAFGQTQDAHTLVADANAAFDSGDFEAALEGYRSAEVSQPESPELAYNQGVAHYKLGDYDAARSAFNRALLTRDLALEAKIKFNLGDVAYASALEKQSNLEEAIELLKTGIGRYRDTLELDPKDQDARTNIETAQLLIKDLLDKLKKQQEEQEKQQQDKQDDQDQQKEKGDQDQEQKQEGQEGDEQEQDQQEKKDDQQQGDKKDEEKKSGDQQDQQDKQQQEQQQQQPSDEMTSDEAERMLQAVRDKEKQRRDEQAQRRRARHVRPPKDW